MRSGIALSPQGGGAGRDEGTVGGIPFKEDPNAPRPRSGGPAGGAARENNNDPGKKNGPRSGIGRGNANRSRHRLHPPAPAEVDPLFGPYAVWENEADQKKFFNVTFARTYMDEARNFHDTDRYGRDDLPLVAKLAD